MIRLCVGLFEIDRRIDIFIVFSTQIGNHDNSRPATRYGHYFIDGLHMIQMLLPGTAIVYNGDELCMEDTYIRYDQTKDPPALYAGPGRYKLFTRDPERTPFQWDNTENAGQRIISSQLFVFRSRVFRTKTFSQDLQRIYTRGYPLIRVIGK